MAKNNSKEFNDLKNNIAYLEEYFKEDFDDLETEYKKSKEYSQIIDAQIKELTDAIAEGNARGAQHYLTEYISNISSLQSQRQSIIKDRVNMKMKIIELYKKQQDTAGNGDTEKIASLLEKFINSTPEPVKEEVISQPQNEEDLDAELEAFFMQKQNENISQTEHEEMLEKNTTIEKVEEIIEEQIPVKETETKFVPKPTNNLSNAERLQQINDMLKRK